MVGIVSIASVDSAKVDEAERQIQLILDPPTAEVGATYQGRVVNITKFGAFVNILPGRDGLLHISKIGGGKRIDRVEDVLELGQEVAVTVEDVDPNGKISLKPEGAPDTDKKSGREPREPRGDRDRDRGRDRGGDSDDDSPASDADTEVVSFEAAFDEELAGEYGDLGPDAPRRSGGGGGGRGRGRGRR
jgi:polyribonucleotide nucleotidyltransferase